MVRPSTVPMVKRIATVLTGVIFVFSACSHTPSHSPARESHVDAGDSKLEQAAEKAVDQTEEDERQAPAVQRELNAIFFKNKQESPGGLDAFSSDRVQELEMDLMRSGQPAIRYYVGNRDFFDRVEDSGGGFRVLANAKRLVPYRWTKAGRRKLFLMDQARVKEMIASPCFAALEDCGEYSSDGEENTALLSDWVKKYGEKEYQIEREKVIRNYLGVLEKYRKRVARGLPKKSSETAITPKAMRAKQAELLVSGHIHTVEHLLKD